MRETRKTLEKPGEGLTPNLFSDPFRSELEEIVKKAVREAMNGHHEGDKLLNAEEASEILSVGEDWLYRHHKKLPFTRKLAPRVLRFSYHGIQKYLASRKNA